MATTRSPRLRRETGQPEAILRAAARSRNGIALNGPRTPLLGFAMSRPGGDAGRCHRRPVFFRQCFMEMTRGRGRRIPVIECPQPLFADVREFVF